MFGAPRFLFVPVYQFDYHYLVILVPRPGKGITRPWYIVYQAVVHGLPRRGTFVVQWQ